MKLYLTIILCICSLQLFYSQEDDGVVSLALPVRNSLTFNQYMVNPTFSFVREQYKYVSFTNKREWVQFDDAPLSYMASYSGRFKENIGVGVGLFQQNYGVLTTFGGLLNFAYNIRVGNENNLTFGMNLGAYNSGVNDSNVVTNLPDPSLNNIPSNFLMTISPGINYGTMFFDFGLSVNNLLLYNFTSSELLKDDPQQSVQAHLRYTGYMDSRGFFDQSKFSGLVRTEFKKDETIISGIAMLTIPKGLWAQVGYNTLYGVSGGLGLNITKQIAIEYNFEKALGDLTDFGPSHDITLAYRFKNKGQYYYSQEDEVSALITPTKKKKAKPTTAKRTKAEVEANRLAKAQAAEQTKLKTEADAKEKDEERQKLAAEAEAQKQIEEQARRDQQAKEKAEAEEKSRLEAEVIAKRQEQERLRLAAEAETLRLAEEAKKTQEEEQARLAAEAKVKAEQEEQARLEAEAQLKAEAEALAKLQEEERIKAEQEEITRIAAEEAAKKTAEEQVETKVDSMPNPSDALGKSMVSIEQVTNQTKVEQEELITKLTEAVNNKDQDLKDLKEENDLGDKGIYLEPKPFKSISEENKAIETLITDLDAVIEARSNKIKELEELNERRQEVDTVVLDEVYLYYQKTLDKLKAEQRVAVQTKADLISRLETIEVATEFERKRRIKRAAYNNEEDRYQQDRAALKGIKANTPLSTTPLKAEDFDFGEEQSNNIQILKNVNNVESGFYLVVAVHKDVTKRDEFLRKAVAAGQSNIDFFFDVNTSKYYIYYKKLNNINEANEAFKTRGSRSYNDKLSVIKIEN